jgi:predicted phage tail protein
MANGDSNERRGALPVPDPTLLTTEALLRESAHLRDTAKSLADLANARVDALEERLDAYGKFHEAKHRDRAAEVEKATQHLTELAAERFAGIADRLEGIQLQLIERDARVTESSQASKDAIAAALAAQKEAVAKSEEATKEQITSIKTENATTVSSLESKIENVKDLIAVVERQVGQQTGRGAGLDLALTRTLALAGVLVAILVAVVGFYINRS